MKEFMSSVLVSIGSLFGVALEEPQEHSQELENRSGMIAPKELWQAQETPTEAVQGTVKEETQNTTPPPQIEIKETDPHPVEGVVRGSETISERKEEAESGTVSTIWGNGVQGQSETQMDHPRKLQIDSKGNIWFVDGSQKNAKLRMFDGEKTITVVDLVENRLTDKDGYFMAAGLGIINDNVYISSTDDLYKEHNGHLVQVDMDIRHYMDEKNAEYIYRMREYKEELYLMLMSKHKMFHFAKYNPDTGKITQVTEPKSYASPYNFFVHKENEIMIATKLGYVVWEQVNPRKTEYIDFGDHQFQVMDVWVDNDRNLYMVTCEEQVMCNIYMDPPGNGFDDTVIVAGGRRGFTDGFKNEVEMDYPMDFVWDGTGYIFGDTGNNSIRKLWWSEKPSDE